MNKLNSITLIFTLLALFASSVVSAHGGYNRFNFGINLGHYPGYYGYSAFGYQDPFFYPPVYSYPPTVIVPVTPPVVIPSTPPVYTQKKTTSSMQPQTNYWHYCSDSDSYYPYVKECPGGWLQVAPKPAQ